MSQLDLEPDSLDRSGRQALSDQVAEAIEARIVSGRLRAGDRLPTTRDLAAALRVNRGTVQAAYRALSQKRLVEGRVGSGTVVRETAASDKPFDAAALISRRVRGIGEEAGLALSEPVIAD